MSKKKKRARGRGIVVKELKAIGQALAEQTEEPEVPERFRESFAGLDSPDFAEIAVRYLRKCALCDSPITELGRCSKPECGYEWGNPFLWTVERFKRAIAEAREALAEPPEGFHPSFFSKLRKLLSR